MRPPHPDSDNVPWWLMLALAIAFVLLTGSPLWILVLIVVLL